MHTTFRLVHRDIKLDNFFQLKPNEAPGSEFRIQSNVAQILLNDWGCAVSMDEDVIFEGSLHMASERILQLQQGEKYRPHASDDLESVVKCVYHRVYFADVQQLLQQPQVSDRILNFWKIHLAPKFWSDMLDQARHLDYAGLKESIEKILV